MKSLILFAMKMELQDIFCKLPITFFEYEGKTFSKLPDKEVYFYHIGIGAGKLSDTVVRFVEKFGIESIYNIGTALSLDSSLELYSICNINEVSFLESGRKFLLNSEKGVSILTVLTPVLKKEQKKALAGRAQLVDMESFFVCDLFASRLKNLNLIKVVSDTVHEDTDLAQFKKRMPAISKKITDIIAAI